MPYELPVLGEELPVLGEEYQRCGAKYLDGFKSGIIPYSVFLVPLLSIIIFALPWKMWNVDGRTPLVPVSSAVAITGAITMSLSLSAPEMNPQAATLLVLGILVHFAPIIGCLTLWRSSAKSKLTSIVTGEGVLALGVGLMFLAFALGQKYPYCAQPSTLLTSIIIGAVLGALLVAYVPPKTKVQW